MKGFEITAAAVLTVVVAWAARKIKRVGRRADVEVDLVLDGAMDRFHDFVVRHSGSGSARARQKARAAELDTEEQPCGQVAATHTQRRSMRRLIHSLPIATTAVAVVAVIAAAALHLASSPHAGPASPPHPGPAPALLFVGPLTGHTGGVQDVAYAPDGKTLATTSNDSTVRIWQVA